ncbi:MULTISPECIES: serine hydrolase domain-containing protein [unclassified Streptomyces]|uniref:serine hydrolase domain-containing protein n=1 Tax=unclassified Streptomyces TaxID=2593676 RepID=UPI0038226DB6
MPRRTRTRSIRRASKAALLTATALALVGTGATVPASATRPPSHHTTQDRDLRRALDTALAKATADAPGQGVQAVLLRHGRLVWSAHRGEAVNNVHPAIRVDDDTMFNLGSLGKLLLGTFALHEVEKGELALDKPLSTYVGDTVAGSRKVTLRMLLSQTSGYGNVYADPAVVPLFPPGTEGAPAGTAPNRYRPNVPFTFQQLNAGIHNPKSPGARYEYQDTNFIVLLQVLVKRLGGENAVKRQIARFYAAAGSVAPQTGRRLTQDRYAPHTLRHFAHGYHPLADGLGVQDYNTAYGATGVPTDSFGFPFGDGSFAGTALGAAQALDALFARGTLLRKPTVDEMVRPTAQARAADATYGLATERTVVDGVTWQGHPGSFGGFTSTSYTDRRHGTTLVVLTNRDRPSPSVSEKIWTSLAKAYGADLN